MDYSINLDESKFANDVNTITEEFDINQNVELFIWWNKEFRNSLPNCIKSQDGLWLSINDECYFLDGSFNDITIPFWVKVPAIDGDYQTILFEKTKNIESVKRIIESSDSNSSISRIISQNNIFPLITLKHGKQFKRQISNCYCPGALQSFEPIKGTWREWCKTCIHSH